MAELDVKNTNNKCNSAFCVRVFVLNQLTKCILIGTITLFESGHMKCLTEVLANAISSSSWNTMGRRR